MEMLSKKEIGDLGEDLASRFISQKGYRVVGKNYLKKWGEIDLIAERSGRTHFIEVKTFSRETYLKPEDNVHPGKLKRLNRAIQSYIEEFHVKGELQVDVVTVQMNLKDKTARCRIIKNVL